MFVCVHTYVCVCGCICVVRIRYDIFGKYGSIYQIRIGNTPETRGRALVVYDDIHDAKQACEHLNGFNVLGRYIVVLYYQPPAAQAAAGDKAKDLEKKAAEINAIKNKYGVKGAED